MPVFKENGQIWGQGLGRVKGLGWRQKVQHVPKLYGLGSHAAGLAINPNRTAGNELAQVPTGKAGKGGGRLIQTLASHIRPSQVAQHTG
jgi:hypothetical protein